MAPTSGRKSGVARKSRKSKQVNSISFPEFDLPYFAHQQLDPQKYKPGVGLPVGKPAWAPAPKEIATGANGGWDDDVDILLDDDLDTDSVFDSPASQINRRRRSGGKGANPYKRLKVAGGRPAIAKKVTADLDSDDELIVRMKNAKYLEKDIAQRLVDEGRVAYHPKTIGTRWARLKRVLEQRNDELLDAELTDWHEGDDEVLYEAVRRADELVAKAKQDADNRKWRIVSDQMKSLKPVVSFSRNACRSRYEDLQAGTAKPTPESVENPDEDILQRIQSRRDKEMLINQDRQIIGNYDTLMENIQGNGWTSKSSRHV